MRISRRSLMALGQYDEARNGADRGGQSQAEFHRRAPACRISSRSCRATRRRWRRSSRSSVGVSETNAAFGWQAHASAFAGHVAEAHEQFHRGVADGAAGELPRGGRAAADGGCGKRMRSPASAARRGEKSTAGLELSRDNLTLERASRALGLCGFGEASTLTERADEAFPDARR